jgi:predicted protein tyrosine phosphatase
MSRPLKLLFVCSRNRWRSPTAEKVFGGVDGIQARSAGTETSARIKVTAGHIGWADIIFVMEKKHLRRLREKFADEISGKRVVCLNIPDEFQFMQPELIQLLESAVPPHLQDSSQLSVSEGQGGGESECVSLALTPTLSPEEREIVKARSDNSGGRPVNPVADISKDAERVSPSPGGEGQDEGGRPFKPS